jgi:hypothetical protein
MDLLGGQKQQNTLLLAGLVFSGLNSGRVLQQLGHNLLQVDAAHAHAPPHTHTHELDVRWREGQGSELRERVPWRGSARSGLLSHG